MSLKTAALFAVAILPTGISHAQTGSDARTEEVTEAAFRHQLAFWLRGHARQSDVVVCLSVDQGGAERSVTQEYLPRFVEPAVRRGIDCEARPSGPVERKTGRPAVMVTVGPVSWPAPDEAWVTIRYSRRLSSGSQQFRIVKEQARWICLGPIVKLSPA
jgi:hypothetical protein